MKKYLSCIFTIAMIICMGMTLNSCSLFGDDDEEENGGSSTSSSQIQSGWYVNTNAVDDWMNYYEKEANEHAQAGDYQGMYNIMNNGSFGSFNMLAIHIMGQGVAEYGTTYGSRSVDKNTQYYGSKNFRNKTGGKFTTSLSFTIYYCIRNGGFYGENPTSYTISGNTITMNNGDKMTIGSSTTLIIGNNTYKLVNLK